MKKLAAISLLVGIALFLSAVILTVMYSEFGSSNVGFDVNELENLAVLYVVAIGSMILSIASSGYANANHPIAEDIFEK